MEILSEFTPREAGSLVREPETSFLERQLDLGVADRCPLSACSGTVDCMATQTS